MKNKIDKSRLLACIHYENRNELVREPVVGLIKWLRPKGLKVCSYVEKCAELKKSNCRKKSAGTQKCYAQRNTPGVCDISK